MDFKKFKDSLLDFKRIMKEMKNTKDIYELKI